MLDEVAAAERRQRRLLGLAVNFLVDGDIAVEAAASRHREMHGFDRWHHAANEIEEAALFGNAAEHPGVAVAGEDMLEDSVAPVRDGAHFDDVAQPLRSVVAGELAERAFH